MDSFLTHRAHASNKEDGSQETVSRGGSRLPEQGRPVEQDQPSPMVSRETISNALSELRTMRPARPAGPGSGASAYAAATVGESDTIQRLRSQIKRIAPYFRTALIIGVPGTAKEGVARMLHALSPCADGEFIAAEASTLAESMMRDEAGAILESVTGTTLGGTIYLNEVAETPLPLQGALLRLWSASGRGKMRVVAGTHRDLRTLGVTGQFRPDLAQRLMGVEVAIPALAERREDVAAVIHEVLHCIGGERALKLSPDALARLLAHRWTGDIAEVDSVLRAAANTAGRRSMIEAGNLPELRTEDPDGEAEIRLEKLDDVVRQHVLGVLTRCGGNKLRAAEVLGISRSTLYRMLDTCVGEGFAIG